MTRLLRVDTLFSNVKTTETSEKPAGTSSKFSRKVNAPLPDRKITLLTRKGLNVRCAGIKVSRERKRKRKIRRAAQGVAYVYRSLENGKESANRRFPHGG